MTNGHPDDGDRHLSEDAVRQEEDIKEKVETLVDLDAFEGVGIGDGRTGYCRGRVGHVARDQGDGGRIRHQRPPGR